MIIIIIIEACLRSPEVRSRARVMHAGTGPCGALDSEQHLHLLWISISLPPFGAPFVPRFGTSSLQGSETVSLLCDSSCVMPL